MPVLMEVLAATYASQGLAGLAAQLCGIEDLWHGEDGWAGPAAASVSLDDSLGQLDQLLMEIRGDQPA